MNSLSDIKRRLVSVKQTRQITGAMETVSISKMRKATERYETSREYVNAVRATMRSAAGCVPPPEKPRSARKAVFVVAADKGLCGAFNHDVLRLADGVIDADTVIIPIGKTAAEYFRKRENVDNRFVDSIVGADYAHAKSLADVAFSYYDGGAQSVSIVYNALTSHSAYAPIVRQVLPCEQDAEARVNEDGYEPSAAEVCARLLPMYLECEAYDALLSSAAAEHMARRAAMSASTRSADEMIAALSIEYNRARQGAVTEQITEIIGSTSALDKRRR